MMTVRRAEIAVFEKALAAAHGVWGARRDMFRQVYWQHTVRSFKAMLAFAVRRILLQVESDVAKGDQFWREFKDWLFDWQSAVPPLQNVGVADTALEQTLADVTSETRSYTSLAPTDDSLLEFLSRWSDEQGRAILRRIRMREPYRRVAVMSYELSRARFDNLYLQFTALRSREDHKEIERLRATWQRAVIDLLESQLKAKGVDVLPGGWKPSQAIENMNLLEPAVLVDVPMKGTSAKSGDESFLYVPEAVSGVHSRTNPFPEAKEAAVRLAQASFDREVGKIRVFVAPEWSEAVARFLSDNEILEAIVDA